MPTSKKARLKKTKKIFSIGEAVRFGWKSAVDNIEILLAVAAIRFLLDAFGVLFDFLWKHNGGEDTLKFLGLFGRFFLYWPMDIWISTGTLLIAIKLATSKDVLLMDLFPSLKRTLKFLAGSILVGVLVLVGFLLLIVPGIIWAIKYQFVPYLMADKLLPMGKAFDLSEKMTKGQKWDLFRFGLNCVGILLLGLLVFCVGIFWAMLVVQIAASFVYRKLLLKADRRLALKAV